MTCAPSSSDDDSAREWKDKGNASLNAGGAQEALECYERGLAVVSDSVLRGQLHSNCALVLLREAGQDAAALTHCRLALEADPGSVKACLRGALSAARLGQPDVAAVLCEQGLALEPTHRELQALLAKARGPAQAPSSSPGPVQVEMDALLGRVLVARRRFAPGDTVLREEPLLSPAMATPLPSGEWPGLLREEARLPSDLLEALFALLAFAQAEPEMQEEVRQGFYAPQEQGRAEPGLEERASMAVRGLRIGGVSVAKADALKVLLALQYNAFSYPALDRHGQAQDTCALFRLGSKCEHCCVPSCVYKVDRAGAPARFVAVRPIDVGERISLGYVDCSMPTQLRHRHCRERFAFVCRCFRCGGSSGAGGARPDAARTVRCQLCGGRLQPIGVGRDSEWRCAGGENFVGCGSWRNSEEVRQQLGLDELSEAAAVQEDLARGGLTVLAEVEAWLSKLEPLGSRHWAVRALQRRRLGLLLQDPGPLPSDAGQAALDGLLAAVEDGGLAAAAQVAWEGMALAVAVRLCRAGQFAQAATLAAACLPVLRIVYEKDSDLLALAERLAKACEQEDASLLDAHQRSLGVGGAAPPGGAAAGHVAPHTLLRFVD